MKIVDLIRNLTLEQAIGWNDSTEKLLYVSDDILAVANEDFTDTRLLAIETKFEVLLAQAGIAIK